MKVGHKKSFGPIPRIDQSRKNEIARAGARKIPRRLQKGEGKHGRVARSRVSRSRGGSEIIVGESVATIVGRNVFATRKRYGRRNGTLVFEKGREISLNFP